MTLWYLGILLALSITHGQNFGCTAWKDSFLSFANVSASHVQIEVFSFSRPGWLSISFSDEKNVSDENAVMVMGYLPNNAFFVSSHPFGTWNTSKFSAVNVSVVWDQSTWYSIDNMIRLVIRVPYSLVSTRNWIGFARRFDSTPLTLDNVMTHQDIGWRINPLVNDSLAYQQQWCVPTFLKLPGRLPAFHVGFYVPYMCIYILLFICMIFFRNRQPLQSRGFGPCLGLFASAGNLTFEFVINNTSTYEDQYHFLCITTGFGEYVFPLMMALIPTMYYFRYVALLNINVSKLNIVNGRSMNPKLPLISRVMNKVRHPLVILIVCVTILSVYLTLAVIIFSAYGWKCGGGVSTIMRYLCLVVIILIVIPCILFQIWDYCVNWRILSKCKLRKFFIDDDHYYYRLEVAPAFVCVVIGVIWVFVSMPSMFKILFCELIYFWTCWCMFGFSMTVTIFNWIFEKCRPSRTDMTSSNFTIIDQIFANEEILALFRDFCTSEFSLENFYFRQSVVEYRALSGELRADKASEMYQMFLTSTSALELNVPSSSIVEIKSALQEGIFPETLFDGVSVHVRTNLLDTYLRFCITKQFILTVKKQEMLGIANQVTLPSYMNSHTSGKK